MVSSNFLKNIEVFGTTGRFRISSSQKPSKNDFARLVSTFITDINLYLKLLKKENKTDYVIYLYFAVQGSFVITWLSAVGENWYKLHLNVLPYPISLSIAFVSQYVCIIL